LGKLDRLIAVLALGVLVLCGACAAPQTRQLLESPPAELPAKTVLNDVPFFSQRAYYCGPAALAMAMNYHGVAVSQKSLAQVVYVPELKGSLQAEMLAATRSHGLLAYVLRPTLESFLKEIAAGHPVVVLQNLSVRWYPVWHYAVAIGYDLVSREIILHSGRSPGYRVPLATFERTWARGDHWALVPLPPTILPADDDPLRVLKAAAALEQTGQMRAALKAYAAATRRWPDNAIARMGLGNTRYALNDTEGAADAFLAATMIDPHSAAAYNNLAVSLLELGCHRDAFESAWHAVVLDEADNPNFRGTLEEVGSVSALRPEPARCSAFATASPMLHR
jgi:tetratricopeptide (TPR) repeat protein